MNERVLAADADRRDRSMPSNGGAAGTCRDNRSDRILGHKDPFIGNIFDLGPGGAFIAVDRVYGLVVGEGVRLRFYLPEISELNLLGKVSWIRNPSIVEDPIKCGVEFHEISESEREAITRYLKRVPGASRTLSLPVNISEKFKVQCTTGRVWIWINGFLNRAESRQLRLLLDAESRSIGSDALLAFLDARRLLACPDESLEEIRLCLARMSKREWFRCIVLAFNPVAMLQLRRIAFLANIEDSVVYFDDSSQATAYWRKMHKKVSSLQAERIE